MRLVPLVHVHDHGRHALERACARERAGVDRPARDELVRELQREPLGVGVVAADERVLVRRRVRERRRSERVQAGDDRRVELVLSPLRRPSDASPSGFTPSGAEGELGGDREDGRSADRLAQLRGRCRPRPRPSPRARRGRLRGRRSRSWRPVAPDGSSAASSARSGIPRADDDVRAGLDQADRNSLAEAARSADDGDLHAAASSTVSASRRDGARGRHQRARDNRAHGAAAPVGSDSSTTSASIRPS